MDEKKQELRVEVEHPDGGSVWLPISEVDAWRRGQEKLRQGDPEALKQLEQQKSEDRKFLAELIAEALKAKE